MRRGLNSTNQYIEARINLLKDGLSKTSNEYDKMWYKRLIQELDWASQMSDKPTNNCSLDKIGVFEW